MSAIPQTSGWQAGFLTLLPAVETHARIKFRKLRADQREEAIQETIAAACMQYQLAAAHGKLHAVHPSTLADFAVRHTRTGRHVGGCHDRVNDVLSANCHRTYGVKVQGLPSRSWDGTDGWRQQARRVPVPDLAAFRIDFTRWLKTFAQRDRRIIAALADGHSGFAVADRFGVSAGRVSQLRRKYERMWALFQGELPKHSSIDLVSANDVGD
jgi:hypothetical protein